MVLVLGEVERLEGFLNGVGGALFTENEVERTWIFFLLLI